MRQARRVAAALSAGLLLLTACTRDDETDDAPAPIGSEENDVEGEGEDNGEDEEPFAVPDEIDEAYAEDVINALLEIDTEIFITALQQEQGEPLDVEAVDKLHAISEGDRRAHLMERLQQYIDRSRSTENLLPPDEMYASRIEVEAVIHAEPEACMIVAGWWDLRGNAVNPFPREEKSIFSLSRLDREVTAKERNPTPWAIRAISPLEDADGDPIPEELWGDIDFGDALDRTCKAL